MRIDDGKGSAELIAARPGDTRAALERVLGRAGVYVARARRSLWLHGDSTAAFDGAARLIGDLRQAYPSTRMVFTTPEPRVHAWLRARYPGHAVVLPPWNAQVIADRFFAQLDPAALLWLGAGAGLPAAALLGARRRGVPIVVVDASATAVERVLPRALAHVALFLVQTADAAERLRAHGATAVEVSGELRDEAYDPGVHLPTFRQLEPFLQGLRAKPSAVDHFAYRRMRRFARSWLGQRIAERRSLGRIPDLQSLRQRLRCPETILCLGNGPSSEDAAVLAVEHDCLMRVNHRWRERGILARPNVVFVGDLRTTRALPPFSCIFGFRTILKEQEVLLRHLFLGLRLEQIEHFTLEREPSWNDTRESRANPTNGAVMVATAAMLQPRRLVIAGIDLYSDPRGRYAGESIGENEYSPAHRRNDDIAVIARALASFRGEVTLLSKNLERALRDHDAP